jgi:hypothetical protein
MSYYDDKSFNMGDFVIIECEELLIFSYFIS